MGFLYPQHFTFHICVIYLVLFYFLNGTTLTSLLLWFTLGQENWNCNTGEM